MAIDYIKNVKISAIACAVPDSKLTYKDFYDFLDKNSVKKFVQDVGVKEKYYSKNRKTMASDLCFAAAEEIFTRKKIEKKSIDGIIFITQTPDYLAPNTASTLQYRLGLPESCMAYDVNLGCSGYPYGIHIASSKLQSGFLKRILLLVGETDGAIAPSANFNDLLFGDCGSATIIDYEENAPGFRFNFKTIGKGFNLISANHGLRFEYSNQSQNKNRHLDGIPVFTFSITEVPKQFKSFFKIFNTSIENYDRVLLHQANKSMINVIVKKIKADKEKVPLSLERYGNTSSATIPNAICDYYGKIDEDKNEFIIMSGFGIGLSLGMVDAYINPKDILPIISTDITWDEGR